MKAAPEQWRRIGEEVSEQLDYEPGRFLRRRLIRPKYVRKEDSDAAPVIAPLPVRLQDGSLPTRGLLAHVLVGKYVDHLPLYRQEKIFARRHGVNLPRQTLARWVELVADRLQPVYRQIQSGVMSGGYVQIDETPVDCLDPGRGKAAQGYLWTCASPQGDVVFHWETSRAAACLANIVPVDFTGTVQCDGYAAYPSFAKQHPKPVVLAGWFLRQIQLLYQVEATLREKKSGPALRASRPVVERFHGALVRHKTRHLPKSLLGQAIDYALAQWSTLAVYLADGRVEIDNNRVENAIRPTALGKKNWLFMGEAGAGQRGASLYTIVESCRRRGIDPFAYLKDVLARLPAMTTSQLPEILPAAWAKARQDAQKIAA